MDVCEVFEEKVPHSPPPLTCTFYCTACERPSNDAAVSPSLSLSTSPSLFPLRSLQHFPRYVTRPFRWNGRPRVSRRSSRVPFNQSKRANTGGVFAYDHKTKYLRREKYTDTTRQVQLSTCVKTEQLIKSKLFAEHCPKYERTFKIKHLITFIF